MARGYLTVRVTSDTRGIDEYKRRLPERTDAAIKELADNIAAVAYQVAVDNEVWETGALAESVHVVPTGEHSYRIQTGPGQEEREYGLYQELGWTGRTGIWHPGRPFMKMAAELVLEGGGLAGILGEHLAPR